jgi:tRNA (guanine-N7-)-methyltransferase
VRNADSSGKDAFATGFQSSAMAIRPDVLDVGCGFGGLTIALSPLLPQSTILGLEIRAKVTEYVRLRIVAQRKENPGQYQNCSVMRTNAMKYLPNFFPKAGLTKIFFCFPDPHFKRKNHPRRIVSERLLTEYAYLLKPDVGRLYAITDVKDLHDWHVAKCQAHPLFEELSQEEMDADPCVAVMRCETEEGKKVMRSGGSMYYAVYKRVNDPGVNDVGNSSETFFKEGCFGVEVTNKNNVSS